MSATGEHKAQTRVSAGLVRRAWELALHEGVSRAELLAAAGLDVTNIDNPSEPIAKHALEGVMRALYRRTQDPALGIRLADAFDLRHLGFWGYALRSCFTLRQSLQLATHYQRIFNHAGRVWLTVTADKAIIEITSNEPADLFQIAHDFAVAMMIREFARASGDPRPRMSIWLSYPELPHHAELRARIAGSLVFGAENCRIELDARELDRRQHGDGYLVALCKQQLDTIVAKLAGSSGLDVLGQVRDRLTSALASDPSLARIAEDLRVSARTLRRQLTAAGASFQDLVDEARQAKAIGYLTQTNLGIKEVAARLGYRDPSNFRRAFRRWTGQSPAAYRTQHYAHAPIDGSGAE